MITYTYIIYLNIFLLHVLVGVDVMKTTYPGTFPFHELNHCVMVSFQYHGVEHLFTIYKNHLLTFAIGSSTVPGFFNTMRKQFTSYEWQTIKSQTTEWKQLEMFYRHWVRLKKFRISLSCGGTAE